MLALRAGRYDFDSLITSEYSRIDFNIRGANTVNQVGYIRSKYIESAMAPLAFNEIGILQQTFCISSPGEMQIALNTIEELYTNLSQTRLGLFRIYTNNVDNTYNSLTNDLFTLPPTAVQELYNKCMDQVRLREDIARDIHTKIKVMKGKHAIVLVTDYDDINQASDHFLTIGLIPVLFPDWKDKFDELELDYFKVLVNRSQVKRISNVKAQEAFLNVANSEKYRNLLASIRIRNTIENIVANKINTARRQLQDSEQQGQRLLQQYEELRSKYYEASKTLSNLEKSREETVEELNVAINMEGVVDVSQYDNITLEITMRAPAIFFNTDEAELVVNNMPDNWVKRLFKDVFVDQKYKMMILSKFWFSFTGGRSIREPGEIPTVILNQYNAMYNPHTYFFRCLGDYKAQLVDAQAKQDLLLFNNLALASVKSINFRDGAVINRWKDTLLAYSETYNSNYTSKLLMDIKCLIDEDGKSYSFRDIYFNNNEEQDEEQDEEQIQELDVEDLG